MAKNGHRSPEFERIRRHFNRRQVLKSAAAGAGVAAAPMLGHLPGASAQGVTLKVLVPPRSARRRAHQDGAEVHGRDWQHDRGGRVSL